MRHACILGAVGAVAVIGRPAAAEDDHTKTQPRTVVHHEESNKAHFVTARYDWGTRGSMYGVGYLHAWEFGQSTNGLGAFGWYGAGLDVRLATADHDAVDGLIVAVPLRASMMGDAGGSGIELSAGLNVHGDTIGVLAAGAYFGVYFVDIGYSYQFAVGGDRPDWLASHMFSIRAQIPVHRYDRYEKTEKRADPDH